MRVIREINRGGFGIVEEVELDDGTTVARKVFNPSPAVALAADMPKLIARFKREVKVQRALPRRFCIPVLDSDLEAIDPWFTMPLAERNYAEQIAEDRANQTVTTAALTDILDALEELHALGFTHRDLKPQNVLRDEGRWKLSDFGLVLPPSGATTTLTSTGSAWGSMMYCAPEQAQDFRHVRPTADIYAFGCILHDLFSGQPRVPYHRQTCSGAVGLIVEKCTELNPSKRFKSISAVRAALFSVLSQPHGMHPSVKAEEWVTALEDLSAWDANRFTELVQFIKHPPEPTDPWAVFANLDEEKLQNLHGIDAELWESLIPDYCKWATGPFQFEFCDVVVRRLEVVFALGSLDAKAAAALSIARLGAGHNRWKVMGRLLALCGPDLEEQVARRIAIEIAVEDAQQDFHRCAVQVSRPVTAFHPLIVESLQHIP